MAAIAGHLWRKRRFWCCRERRAPPRMRRRVGIDRWSSKSKTGYRQKPRLIRRASRRSAVHPARVRGAVAQIAAWRRGAHRPGAFHVALCGCRRGQTEARPVSPDHARPLSRRSGDGRSAEVFVDSRQGNPRRERIDVSRIECRHHHRAGHRSAAVALQGRHARQDPVYSQLGHAGSGRAADSVRQSLSPLACGAFSGRSFRQSRLYA